jgi:two-component system NtrC family sensor kinase
MRAHDWQSKAFVALAALLSSMGLRVALTPWLGDAIPVEFAIPATAAVSYLCGFRWGVLLAGLVIAWVSIPWLPPSWPSHSPVYLGSSAISLAAASLVGLLRKRERQTGLTLMPIAREVESAQRALRLSMVIAAAVPLVLLGALAWSSQQAAMTKARQQADAAALLAAEHINRLVQANTIVTRQVMSRLARLTPADVSSFQPILHRDLVSLAEGLPHINSIWVIGADGYPLASSLFSVVPRINYQDREYFQFHQKERGQPYVSRLLRSRSSGELFYDVSARWEGPGGEFLGVINVSLRPEYVAEFYRQLVESAPATTISLLRSDGFLITRWPQTPELGERLHDDHPVLQAVRAGTAKGWIGSAASRDSAAHAYNVKVLPSWPLVVSVELDHEQVLSAWRRDVALLSAVMLGGSVLVLAALWFALRRTYKELAALDKLAAESEQRNRAEGALRQAQKLEALGQLTGGVAHDFNNLLAVMQNNLHLIALQHPLIAQAPAVAGIQRAVNGGVNLTRKLLAFSRRQAVRPEVINLEQALPQIEDLLRMTAGSSMKVTVSVAALTPVVEVDRSEFELALLNLAMNARGAGCTSIDIKAEGRSRESLSPELCVALPDGPSTFAAITVKDDGAGMTPEIRTRAFEPFFTTKAEGEGTGLGLSQVYGMCAQARGTVHIESQPGQGTAVTMLLPAVSSGVASESPPAKVEATRLTARVLVVEDNVEVAQATTAVLEALGAQVTVAAGASAALSVLAPRRAEIDVVLSDIVMPGNTSGVALALTIRSHYPDLPTLLMTGHTTELPAAIAAGLSVLPKPFTPADLCNALLEVQMQKESSKPLAA